MTRPSRVSAYFLLDGGAFCQRAGLCPDILREVFGRPSLYHFLDRLVGLGLERVVLCSGNTPFLESFLGNEYRGIRLQYSDARAELGTAGALKAAVLQYPSDLLLCLDAASEPDVDLSFFLRWFETRVEKGGLLLAEGGVSPWGRGPLDDSGKITGFSEGGPVGSEAWNCCDVCLLRRECLDLVLLGHNFSVDHLLSALAAVGELCGLMAPAHALDPRTASLSRARQSLASRQHAQGRAAVFLDRDGTVIADKHYLHDPSGVELLPGAAEGLRRMRELGLVLVLVSNQSGVGRGYFSRGDVERVHGRLAELLEEQGVQLDAMYVCPHAPGEECDCRKPAPGLIERACAELNLDPRRSFVVGDKPCDVELGQRVHATTFLVTTGYGAVHNESESCRPDHVAANLLEVSRTIESVLRARSSGGQEPA